MSEHNKSSYNSALDCLKQSFLGSSEKEVWVKGVCSRVSSMRMSILDVGIGTGDSIRKRVAELLERGYDIDLVGVDPQAPTRSFDFALPVPVESFRIPFEKFVSNRFFDVVNATQSLYYLDDWRASISKMLGLTKIGGVAAITIWSERCVLCDLHKAIIPEGHSVITGELIQEWMEDSGITQNIQVLEHEGLVDTRLWLQSSETLEAAARVISRTSINAPVSSEVLTALEYELRRISGMSKRINKVIFASPKDS